MKIGIVGYGNLGRGAEAAIKLAPDMELVGIFTRRDPSGVASELGTPVYSYDSLISGEAGDIDAVIICGGSATDLPTMTPELAEKYNVVDSFDNHANIPPHLKAVDEAAKRGGYVGLISAGWDPGLFSLARIYANAVLPVGSDYTFWGRGISQGHSDAIRRIPGVKDARQYTVPVEESVNRVRSGENPVLTTREKHLRECYVVPEEGANLSLIKETIVNMPNYFSDYDTTVEFISQEELDEKHRGMPHGGSVIRSGKTGLNGEFVNTVEFKLDLESNPYFTSSVLVACARAVVRLKAEGVSGAVTVFDIPPVYLLTEERDELIAHLL